MRKNVKEKTMINKKFRIKDGLPFLLAACIFIGCATGGPGQRDPNAPYGLLTITDIPAESEGWFATAELDLAFLGDPSVSVTVTKAVGDKTVITNGEVTLPLYESATTSGAYLGYTGSDSLVVVLSVIGSKFFDRPTIFVFKEKVNFENGAAKVSLKDSVKSLNNLTITITGIPSQYLDKNDNARIQIAGSTGGAYVGPKLPKGTFARTFSGIAVKDGLTYVFTDDRGLFSTKARSGRSGSSQEFIDYCTSAPTDVGIWASTEYSADAIVFRGLVFTDGKATVDFQQGVKLGQRPLTQ
jgi:hypothetical protein